MEKTLGSAANLLSAVDPIAIVGRVVKNFVDKLNTTTREITDVENFDRGLSESMRDMAMRPADAPQIYNSQLPNIQQRDAELHDAARTMAGIGFLTGIASGDVKVDQLQKGVVSAINTGANAAVAATGQALADAAQTSAAATSQALANAAQTSTIAALSAVDQTHRDIAATIPVKS